MSAMSPHKPQVIQATVVLWGPGELDRITATLRKHTKMSPAPAAIAAPALALTSCF